MKKTMMRYAYTLIIIGSLLQACIALHAKKSTEIPMSRFDDKTTVVKAQEDPKASFIFQFNNEDIVNIINLVAAAKDINIILPQSGKAMKDIKVTFHLDNPITIDRAWDLLGTLLDVAGYSIKLQESMYTIVQTTGDISKEPLPTYIGTHVDDLPHTDQWIRYVHYFANLQVSEDKGSELYKILDTLLPIGSQKIMDQLTNATIIVSKAADIKAVMTIVDQLDKAGFQEKMDIIKLHHTQARMIADLFKQQILPEEVGQQPNRFRLDARKPTDAYFAPNTRIIAEERNNALIVLGRAQAVDRLRDFITNYIDVELESGKSVLHIYKLQYLDAKQVEDVLIRVVETAQAGGTEQSRAAAPGAATPGGPQRLFDEVVIKADKPEGFEQAGFEGYFGTSGGDKGKEITYQYSGGNKLVVAARNSDWQIIKRLIEEIDQPQPQVLIEVLIADLTMDDERQIGSQTRNPAKISLPSGINIQSAQFTNPLVNDIENPTSIAGDLLRAITPDDEITGIAPNGAPSIASLVNPPVTGPATIGSTLIEFNDNDGKTWSLLQILQTFGQTKIISNPHVICTNNKRALISLGEQRLVVGAGDVGNTAANVKNEFIEAKLTVAIKPRISGGGPSGIVNLTVDVDIEEFQGGGNQRIMRTIKTNANVKDSNILALGGLIRTEEDVSLQETPILGRIPILGWFFKNRDNGTIKTNLTVFIRPTVIMPRLRRGVNQYTKDYLEVAKKYLQEGELFDSLRDPITRWFFKSDTPATEIIDEFLKKDEYQNSVSATEEDAQLTPRERRKARKQKQLAARNQQRNGQELKSLIDDENPLLTKGRKKKRDRVL
jgi:general secretion pathway protein D